MSGGFDRRPGGGSLVQTSQGGGAAAAPGKQSLAEQVDRRPATGASAGGLRPAEVKPASPRAYDPLAGQKTLGGTDLAAVNTQPAEAKVLNALRQEDKRFNAAALIVAQKNLLVANATGAFNTETLRQLRTKTSDPRLAAADPKVVVPAILDEKLWKPYHTSPGVDLFFAPVDGAGGKGPDRTATRKADRVAQAMG